MTYCFYLLTAAMVVQGFVIAWCSWMDRQALVARWSTRLMRLRGHGRLRMAQRLPPFDAEP